MHTFERYYFEQDEPYDFQQLEFVEMCDSATVKALIGPMLTDLSMVGFIAAPYGAMLRFAEGVDSIRNLAKTGGNTTETAAAIVCGIVCA